MKTRSKRQANFELLRIVAMLMIISLHYLVKGGAAVPFPFAAKEHPVGVLAWLIESFCIVAVNCYVLISGYFCVESAWKPGRVVSLLCQVLFYSLLVPVILLLTGAVFVSDLSRYDWIGFALPFGTEHYWFATAYLVLYLFAPFLSAGIQKLQKRDLQILLALLLAFFSIEKTIVPLHLATDRYGYDFGWFLCLFVAAGYIRLYGIPWLEKRSHAIGIYVLSCLGIWMLSLCANTLGAQMDAFAYYADMPYTYNHLLGLTGAVSLFYVFKGLSVREGHAADAIRLLAPCTFGVYLLHEHILVRYRWLEWLKADQVKERFLFLPHLIGCVLLVYVVGTAVDLARAWVFGRAAAIPGRRTKQKK